ncbi:MAG TPA: hypothetical protein PLA12_11935 [Candidatus Hydrogenedens sp.]|nr:hypothetical protein [Candidatus Hydrogenedens sp.]
MKEKHSYDLSCKCFKVSRNCFLPAVSPMLVSSIQAEFPSGSEFHL